MLLEYYGGSFLSARSLPWRRRMLVTAVTSVRRSDRLCSSLIRARLDVHGRFDPFSGVQGTSGLRIRVGQRGHASECGAPRIRRRSHQHLAEASALGGPMKDRLRRWLTPVVIDRMRRGTHDRADATGPCRGCATAVSCRAASCMSRRPCTQSAMVHTAHRWRKLAEPRCV